EIGLLDPPVLERHLAPQRPADAEIDATLDLCLHGVGVDDGAAVDGADDPVHAQITCLGHLDLGDLGQVAAPPAIEEGHAAATPGGQRLPPAGGFRRKVEHRAGARRLAQERPPILDGIGLCGGGELIHEALDDERVVGGTHATPEGGVQGRLLGGHELNLDRRDVVQELYRGVNPVAVDPGLERRRQIAGEDGRAPDPRPTVNDCEPVHTSQRSFCTWTVQFIGSIVAWARKGTWYTASIFCAAPPRASATWPCVRATTPGCCEAASSPCRTSAVLTLPLGPSSQRMARAASPCFAAHM